MRPVVVALICALTAAGASGTARANGRFPASVNVGNRPSDDRTVLLPTTFGLLLSSDNGASFRWICEDAIGYGGTFDPDYALSADGTIWATTFQGLRVSRDAGCSWNTIGGPLVGQWVGEVEVAPDGAVWATTSSGGMPNDVYTSADGETFAATGLFHETAWWKSLRVAPSDARRIYVTGYLVDGGGEADAGMQGPEALLRRSDDGGQSWIELPVSDFVFGSQPQLFVEAVSPTDPDVLFARVLGASQPVGDAIYRSTDAGQSWSPVLEMSDTIRAFLIRADGATVIAGSVDGGVRISSDGGTTWNTPASEPKMACLSERADGVLFSCGANWDPDFFTLGRSSDAMAWEKVVRFSEIAGPLSCPAGTVQRDTCEALLWPSLAEQFGIGIADAGPSSIDAGGSGAQGDGKGCGCRTTGSTGGNWILALCVMALLRYRRRSPSWILCPPRDS